MKILDNAQSYIDKFDRHLGLSTEIEAVRRHVGEPAQFHVIGRIERAILERYGLQPESYLIDVGCGSGRLAHCLEDYPDLRYLGVDVVPKLISYCRKTFRSDWRFEVSGDFTIQEEDESADVIAAFSLFTHLLHEQTFAYLKEFHRLLRPGGVAIFSFLDYSVAHHRKIFFSIVDSMKSRKELIMFLDESTIRFFAEHAGFAEPAFVRGDVPIVEFQSPLTLPDGKTLAGPCSLGQAVCVLTKPSAT